MAQNREKEPTKKPPSSENGSTLKISFYFIRSKINKSNACACFSSRE
jgi:hypothetical protein